MRRLAAVLGLTLACSPFGAANEGASDGGTRGSPVDATTPPSATTDGGADPALIVHYSFDGVDGGLVARDQSGHGHDGTIVGGASWTAGRNGGGVALDGATGCIELGASPDFDLEAISFTAAAWVNVRSLPASNSGYIVGRSHDANVAGWRLAVDDDGRTSFNAATSMGYLNLDSVVDITPGTWIHTAIVFVPSGMARYYLNGVRVGSTQAPASIVRSPTDTMRVGCKGNNTNFLDGIVDEVRIYRRALDDAEIAAIAKL